MSWSDMTPFKKPRLIYNDDSCTLRFVPPPHTVERISLAVDYLKGTQVDWFCWCVADQTAMSWPSKVIENAYDLRARGLADYTTAGAATDLMLSLHRQGVDYLPMLIRRVHAGGLKFFASFRMNDTHVKSEPNSIMASDFWKQHQHDRLWEATDAKGYYNAALDYSHAAVRNHYRAGVNEVATEYDVDGIELDFTRSPYLFQPSEAWRKRDILTGFIQNIRNDLERLGAKRRRPLTLILRIPCAERALRMAGIDADRWIRDRLTPALVISELVLDCNQDIERWRTLCRRKGVWLYPSLEVSAAANNANWLSILHNPDAPSHGFGVQSTPAELARLQRAAAQNLLAQKPDGLYLFNFPCRLVEGANLMHRDTGAFRQLTAVLRQVGSMRTLARQDKRYTFYRDLPIWVEANRPRRFHQTIPFAIRGRDVRDADVTLRFRQIAVRNPHAYGPKRQNPIVQPGLLTYYLNDREIPASRLRKRRAPAGRIPSGFRLRAHEIVEVRISGRELCDDENTLAFEIPHYPGDRDPYVYIYELEAEVQHR
ncbi:MAG: hypothetical protein IT578_12240 [Verrucomicrobiae bacterium]|nr:hypothetical protein [Verrucomicrobiae bacterium]